MASIKETIRQELAECKSLHNKLFDSYDLVYKIKNHCEKEVLDFDDSDTFQNEPDDICKGRYEFAKDLYKLIEEWEQDASA